MQENEAPEVKRIIDVCRSLQADAVVLERARQTIVVAMNAYDGTYAVAGCDTGANVSSVARGLQVRLYSDQRVDESACFLPVATVLLALGRWEWQIAVVFGRPYAMRLAAIVVGDKKLGEMSGDDLERIRLRLSSAIGGCLDFRDEIAGPRRR